jgi:hypothetical protein
MEVSKYIHLNPVNTGVITNDSLHGYPWSSYRQYVNDKMHEFLPVDTEFILGLFADNPHIARKKYQEYVMQGETLEEYKGSGGYGVDSAKLVSDERRLPVPSTTQAFLQGLAANYSIGLEAGYEWRKDEIELRNQMIREARKQTQITLKEIGTIFGRLSESMISRILKQD